MAAITANLLPIICLCFTVVHCDCGEKETPWVYQKTFVADRKPFIEFTCGAYLKRGERLTWYKEEPKTILTEIEQRKNGDRQIDLLLPLALLSGRYKILCVKECPMTSDGYTSYEQTSSKIIPIDFYGTIPPLTDKGGVMVTPDAFEESGESLMEFTCWAYLDQREVLSWHQTKDVKPTRLAMIQQENKSGYIKIELKKTLEPSDNSTQLYCAKDTVLPNATLAKGAKSKMIPILFERHYKPIESPYVTVQPSTDNIIFDENDTLTFVCGGSEPVDGRNLTWRIKGADMKRIYLDQSFGKSTKLNHLTLRMKPSYHRGKLYCVQDYKMRLQFTETNHLYYHYGEMVRSHSIKLVHRKATTDRRLPEPVDQSSDADKDSAEPASGQTTVTWWLVGGIVFTVLVVIILMCAAKHYKKIALDERREHVQISNTIQELEAERREELELRSRGPCPLPEQLYDEVYAHGAGLKRPKHPRRAL